MSENTQELRAAGATDRGRVRENNEDSYLCSPHRGIFIVADGMGGHVAGEHASSLVVAELEETLTARRMQAALGNGETNMREFLQQALQGANDAVRALGERFPEWRGMGSTAVVAVLHGSVLHVCNVGDSRAYLVRNGELDLLTRDHSVAALMREKGELTEEEARGSLLRNQLTASLGTLPQFESDYASVRLHSGDQVVLCSDGLWDMIPDSEIARIVAESSSPDEAVKALIEAANEAGGHDNITAVVLETRGGDETFQACMEEETFEA